MIILTTILIAALVVLIAAILFAWQARDEWHAADAMRHEARADKAWAEERHVEATAALIDARAQLATAGRIRAEVAEDLRGNARVEVRNG